jgi:acyl transferase domain-containing protein
MGRELFGYGVFRNSIHTQDFILQGLKNSPSWSLTEILTGTSTTSVQEPEVSQTICTSVQIAIVDLLRSWEVIPSVTVGHSSGEIAAAYAAGHISIAKAIVTAYCRGNSIVKNVREGLMLAVGLDKATASSYLEQYGKSVQLAAINSSTNVTISGDVEAIKELDRRFKRANIFSRPLATGKNAYHSHHMAPIGTHYENSLNQAFTDIVDLSEQTQFQKQDSIPWVSSVAPRKPPSTSAAYWRQNLESPVNFQGAIEEIINDEKIFPNIFIEIGPHSALQTSLKQIFSEHEDTCAEDEYHRFTCTRSNGSATVR